VTLSASAHFFEDKKVIPKPTIKDEKAKKTRGSFLKKRTKKLRPLRKPWFGGIIGLTLEGAGL